MTFGKARERAGARSSHAPGPPVRGRASPNSHARAACEARRSWPRVLYIQATCRSIICGARGGGRAWTAAAPGAAWPGARPRGPPGAGTPAGARPELAPAARAARGPHGRGWGAPREALRRGPIGRPPGGRGPRAAAAAFVAPHLFWRSLRPGPHRAGNPRSGPRAAARAPPPAAMGRLASSGRAKLRGRAHRAPGGPAGPRGPGRALLCSHPSPPLTHARRAPAGCEGLPLPLPFTTFRTCASPGVVEDTHSASQSLLHR